MGMGCSHVFTTVILKWIIHPLTAASNSSQNVSGVLTHTQKASVNKGTKETRKTPEVLDSYK